MSSRLESDRVLVNNRWVHVDGTNAGFLRTTGSWDMYVNNGGSIYSSNYGWLHDFFFYAVGNCSRPAAGSGNAGNCPPATTAVNCYGSGNISVQQNELVDNGATVTLRNVNYFYNCNCNCSTDSCFLPETEVLLADGQKKRIDQIMVGDLVATSGGGSTRVDALWAPILGDRKMFNIAGHVLTTEDHLVMTKDGWACINPARYLKRRFNQPALAGKVNSAIGPLEVTRLEVGAVLVTADEQELAVTFITPLDDYAPVTQLHSLFTASGDFVLANGVVVDGMKQ